MKQSTVQFYSDKLVRTGLVHSGEALVGEMDVEPVWNREDPLCGHLNEIMQSLNAASVVFSKPAEPYFSIIEHLASVNEKTIFPEDSETRTFLHDIPVIGNMDKEALTAALHHRKGAIIRGSGIIACSLFNAAQAYVFYNSLCFSLFVKFFSDYLLNYRKGSITQEEKQTFQKACSQLFLLPAQTPQLIKGPFTEKEKVYEAICETGKTMIENRLVDSFFGNISFRLGNMLYITQTSSFLDELENCIEPCPLDDSFCYGITASSEYTAHRKIVAMTGADGVLHGHPAFSVIMSMFCEKTECRKLDTCYVNCPEKRTIAGIPVVSGEPGPGIHGLYHTVPPALMENNGCLVFGHGVFVKTVNDFNSAFQNLLEIEKTCRREYFRMVQA